MIVSLSNFELVLTRLKEQKKLSLDCETTGLRPYHGDRLFSLILGYQAEGGIEGCYFNFQEYPGLIPDLVLTKAHLTKLAEELFSDASKQWFIHKFNFDMHVLGVEGIELAGEVFCTLTQGRVEYNEHWDYSLGASLQRIGLAKDDKVEKWIEDNHAWEWVTIPGKKQRKKNKFFHAVPFDIIAPYGIDDARGDFALGRHLENSIATQASLYPKGVPNLLDASAIERRLAKTVYRMEKVGVKIDRAYCLRASRYEADRAEKAALSFKRNTGRDYSASNKLFTEIFAAEKDKWVYTEKGNPSFESDILKGFQNPVARDILELRNSKSKLDFYNGFLWHADADDRVHANFSPGGTRTFRFSSSEPNLQNMTSEESTHCKACKEWFEEYVDLCPDCGSLDIEHPEFMVRKAIIPTPGFCLIMPDYDQMEYKMMLDYAKHMMIQLFKSRNQAWDEGYFDIANKVAAGYDVHRATAEMIGFSRKAAKAINFGLLYGEGVDLLALNLGVSRDEAIKMKARYFRALPYVEFMIAEIRGAVKTRGWVRNWAGYKYTFPDRGFAYKAPNTVIQGGCAIVTKIAMNEIDDLFQGTRSRLVLSVHDELPSEIHEKELATLPKLVKERMESIYPYKYIPLTAGMEYSFTNLAEKKKGFPV